MKLKNLEDVLTHELQDLYSAEKQLVDALPKVAKAVTDSKVQRAMEDHLEETKEHVKRIEEIGEELGVKVTGHTCEGMKGLVKEASGLIEENDKGEALDVALIAAAQRVEHYEIAAYGSAVAYAEQLGHTAVAKKLQKTLDEEGKADEKLSKLAESSVNQKAVA